MSDKATEYIKVDGKIYRAVEVTPSPEKQALLWQIEDCDTEQARLDAKRAAVVANLAALDNAAPAAIEPIESEPK